MSGFEDGQRVEISGVVRAVTPGQTNCDFEIASGGYRLHVFPKTLTDIDPMTLVGARVRVKGTAAASFNAALRHMVTVAMFVPLPSDFVVEELSPRILSTNRFRPSAASRNTAAISRPACAFM